MIFFFVCSFFVCLTGGCCQQVCVCVPAELKRGSDKGTWPFTAFGIKKDNKKKKKKKKKKTRNLHHLDILDGQLFGDDFQVSDRIDIPLLFFFENNINHGQQRARGVDFQRLFVVEIKKKEERAQERERERVRERK